MSKRLAYHLYVSLASSWASFFLAFQVAGADHFELGFAYLIGGGGT